MVRFFKSTTFFAVLLFSAQGVQAGLIPTNISEDFGVFTASGAADSNLYSLPSGNPAVNWYEFTLGTNLVGSATVTLDTEFLYDTYPYNEDDFSGPSTNFIDTVLALYDSEGSLILNNKGENQNFECEPGDRYSCSTFSLGAGTYIAGVNDIQLMGSNEPFLPNWMIEDREYDYASFSGLSIAVDGIFGPVSVPEPATLWLLGIGLLGLVGVSRRTAVTA